MLIVLVQQISLFKAHMINYNPNTHSWRVQKHFFEAEKQLFMR